MNRHPVTPSALIQRVRRRLARDGERLHCTRDRWRRDLGAYHAVDASNFLSRRWDDLADLVVYARDVGVLAPSEDVVSS